MRGVAPAPYKELSSLTSTCALRGSGAKRGIAFREAERVALSLCRIRDGVS